MIPEQEVNSGYMKINYEVTENDLLTYQLFSASKSKEINKKRSKNTLLWPSVYIVCGILAFIPTHRINGSLLFFAGAILWIIFYPVWERKHYVSHYLNFVRDRQKGQIGVKSTIEFTDDFLTANSDESESKILYSLITEINEIPSLIIIHLKGGQALLLSEYAPGIDQLKPKLHEIANRFDIEYRVDLSWKWK